jgi:flagellar hook-associated protein 1 FlgK
MDVTGNNIANVNTRGYSRQRVDLRSTLEVDFYNNGRHHLGTGVGIASISRARDFFVDRSASRNFSDMGRLSSQASGLAGIDAAYGEPSDQGIANALGKFFDAFSNLGSDAASAANRGEARRAALVLTDRIRGVSGELARQRSQVMDSAGASFTRINELAEQIADLNKVIAQGGPGSSPNQALDERQLALDELSGLVKIQSVVQQNGTLTITAGGSILVDQGEHRPLDAIFNPADASFDAARASALGSGALVGMVQALADIDLHSGRLDSLASGLRDAVNAVHRTGLTASGTPAGDLFTGTSAASLRVADAVEQSADNIAAGSSGRPGDGGIAQAIADLRDDAMASLGTRTFADYFRDSVSMAANDARQANSQLDIEGALSQQIESQRQQVSGVSLDEEFAEMVKLQRSYQAASRALNVFNEVTEDLLGMIR